MLLHHFQGTACSPSTAMQTFAVLMSFLVAHGATAACSTDVDCNFNGVCTGGSCACDPAWTEANCSKLNFLPANKSQGFNQLNSSWSSWGGSAVHDPDTEMWYLGVSEMANHCGLGTWHSNSRCVIATSKMAGGPYVRQSVVVDPWCHGASLARDPISGRWIFGHMGTGDNKQCFQCERGVTPEGASANSSCGHDSKFETMASALIADSPQGPWTAAPGLINGANCEPFFMPNGTLFYACPWGGKSSAPNCNGQTAFLQMARAESLEDALAGRWTYKGQTPTIQLAGGPPGPICVNWEDQTLWVDSRGRFHSLFHAFRGQPCDYPLPGCHGASSGASCTSLGGHAFSEDGQHWYVSPIAPYDNSVAYDDNTTVAFRARERPHIVLSADGAPIYLSNGLGDPPAGGSGGGNVGRPGADHTFTAYVPLNAAP